MANANEVIDTKIGPGAPGFGLPRALAFHPINYCIHMFFDLWSDDLATKEDEDRAGHIGGRRSKRRTVSVHRRRAIKVLLGLPRSVLSRT